MSMFSWQGFVFKENESMIWDNNIIPIEKLEPSIWIFPRFFVLISAHFDCAKKYFMFQTTKPNSCSLKKKHRKRHSAAFFQFRCFSLFASAGIGSSACFSFNFHIYRKPIYFTHWKNTALKAYKNIYLTLILLIIFRSWCSERLEIRTIVGGRQIEKLYVVMAKSALNVITFLFLWIHIFMLHRFSIHMWTDEKLCNVWDDVIDFPLKPIKRTRRKRDEFQQFFISTIFSLFFIPKCMLATKKLKYCNNVVANLLPLSRNNIFQVVIGFTWITLVNGACLTLCFNSHVHLLPSSVPRIIVSLERGDQVVIGNKNNFQSFFNPQKNFMKFLLPQTIINNLQLSFGVEKSQLSVEKEIKMFSNSKTQQCSILTERNFEFFYASKFVNGFWQKFVKTVDELKKMVWKDSFENRFSLVSKAFELFGVLNRRQFGHKRNWSCRGPPWIVCDQPEQLESPRTVLNRSETVKG